MYAIRRRGLVARTIARTSPSPKEVHVFLLLQRLLCTTSSSDLISAPSSSRGSRSLLWIFQRRHVTWFSTFWTYLSKTVASGSVAIKLVSSYMKDGEKKYMAVTQFELADARRCFPCCDEPAFKATFKMTVHVPKDLVALSNMPVESETIYGTTKFVSFQSSPRMSTYLVAVVIGELEYLESETPSGNKVRVYCEIGKAEQGKFALDVAVKTLPFYEE